MKLSILYLICLTSFISCKHYHDLKEDNEVRGNGVIGGRLFVVDSLTKQGIPSPLGKKIIYLLHAGRTDTLDYIMNTTTSDDGYFSFLNLDPDSTYRLLYKEGINNLAFIADTSLKPTAETFPLLARVDRYRQNGIHIILLDNLATPLANTDICVFTSEAQYNTNSCSGSNYKLKTDSSGRAYIFNIQPGQYYFYSTATIGGIEFVTKTQFKVEDTIVFKKLTMESTITNGIEYVIMDNAGGRVPSPEFCVFTSPVLFARDTCEGSNFTIPADNMGNVIKYNFAKQQYYFYVSKKVGNNIYYQIANAVLDNKVLKDTLYLIQKY
jgi:hypothetical protein